MINDKMKIVLKTFPKQMPVRALSKRNKLDKKTDFSKWSTNIYFIRGYRRPLTPKEDVGIRLLTLSGKSKLNSNIYYLISYSSRFSCTWYILCKTTQTSTFAIVYDNKEDNTLSEEQESYCHL